MEANGAHRCGPIRHEDQVPGTRILEVPEWEGVEMHFKAVKSYIGQFG